MSATRLIVDLPGEWTDPVVRIEEIIWLGKLELITKNQRDAAIFFVLNEVNEEKNGPRKARELVDYVLNSGLFIGKYDVPARFEGQPEDAIIVKFDKRISQLDNDEIQRNNNSSQVARRIKQICKQFYESKGDFAVRAEKAHEDLREIVLGDDVLSSAATVEERVAVYNNISQSTSFPLLENAVVINKISEQLFKAIIATVAGLLDVIVSFRSQDNVKEKTQVIAFALVCLKEIKAALDGKKAETKYLEKLTSKLPVRLEKLKKEFKLKEQDINELVEVAALAIVIQLVSPNNQ